MISWLINSLIGKIKKSAPRRPNKEYDNSLMYKVLFVVNNRELKHEDIDFNINEINEDLLNEAIDSEIDYINHKYDCSDFRVLLLLKLYFSGYDIINKYPNIILKIKNCLINFKYWIKSPGFDSMCYYSENHQLSFIACEYLTGMIFEEQIFKVDSKTGKEHKKIALERFNYWYELRKKYSLSEYQSSNYLPINLAALSMLILYSDDNELINKSKMICDYILSFYADGLFSNTFINASARDYPRNIMNSEYESNSGLIIDAIFGNKDKAIKTLNKSPWLFTEMYINHDNYRVSKDILNIASEKEIETKYAFGLNLKDYKKEGLYNLDDKSLMMMLGSGALLNPEIVNLTYKFIEKYHFYSNNFVSWMRYFDAPILRRIGLMPLISKTFDFFQNGMALEKANIYTYRSEYFKSSILMGYNPGSSGAQKNTMVITLPNSTTIFTNHPLRYKNESKDVLERSPSYFGGYSIAPYALGNKNVVLIQYKIPFFKKIGQPVKMLHFTHTYFDTTKFDEYIIDNNYAFLRVNKTFVSIISKNNLILEDSNDLIQNGRKTYWIYELSNENNESFNEFIKRIKSNKISFSKNTLVYNSKHVYKTIYNKAFYIDNEKINIEYDYKEIKQ